MKKKRKNIALTGMMGCGKSTVAKEIKSILADYTWIEMDAYLEKKECKSINEIFSTYGEDYFRKIESQYIESLAVASSYSYIFNGAELITAFNNK